jgi:alkaline phosphatase D
MNTLNRRQFVALAGAFGASVAWASTTPHPSRMKWSERRDLYPEGVASGDPQADSVILWTRRPFENAKSGRLALEVAEDEGFQRVVATATTNILAAADWTARVLVSGLAPARIYWYRFADESGNGSRIGRTITAPALNDDRPIKFAFVSCQNVTQGAQNAWRKMIYEDQKAPAAEQLQFVLHLGDFIYEITWYPEDRPQGMYDRKILDVYRYANGEKVEDFHVPTTVDDYRLAYRSYLHDPDLQDARARFPFVAMWDNHEFSWLGWQSVQIFDGKNRPAQTKKVAANQAWFEYHPARVRKPGGRSLERFEAPSVKDTPVDHFDEHGFGTNADNRIAVESLVGYRTLRWGRNVDLIITDQHSYRSEEPTGRPEAAGLNDPDFPDMLPEEAMAMLDAGRAYAGGKAPDTISFGEKQIANFRKKDAPQTLLGAEQKAWFIDKLRTSQATWKIWGNSSGTLDWRADPQNLPDGLAKKRWPGAGYAGFGGGDLSGTYLERTELYEAIRKANVGGFVTVSGDRHSFWAGYAAPSLPPRPFEPIGVAFITGSLSAPGLVEAYEHRFPKDHPLRALFLADPPGQSRPQPTVNMLLRRGVRSCLEYQKTGDIDKARALTNKDMAPHLTFVDMGGHGYATVRATSTNIESEFVCIPRPVERASGNDGGPLVYRVTHSAKLWRAGERPALEQRVLEGNPVLSL